MTKREARIVARESADLVINMFEAWQFARASEESFGLKLEPATYFKAIAARDVSRIIALIDRERAKVGRT